MLSTLELAELKERAQMALSHGYQVALAEHYVLTLEHEVGPELPPGEVANSTAHLLALILKAEASRVPVQEAPEPEVVPEALLDIPTVPIVIEEMKSPSIDEGDRVTVPSPINLSEMDTVIVEVPLAVKNAAKSLEEEKTSDPPVEEDQVEEESAAEEDPTVEKPAEDFSDLAEVKPTVEKPKKTASKKKRR